MFRIKAKAPVIFLSLALLCTGTSLVLADDHGQVRHVSHHYYRNGHWYRHGWFGIGVAVPVLSTGVYVNTLPPAYTPVVIQGTTYYYGENTYFRPETDGGYTVVSPPSNT